MAKNQTPALTPDLAEKYRTVVRLRAAGLTFEQIADQVGYASRQGAKEAYDRAIKSWGTEAVDDLRILEGERLDDVWRRTYARLAAANLNDETFARLATTAINVSRRRSELFGLNAPQQVEIAPQEVNVNVEGNIHVESRQQRVERLELVFSALVEAGAIEGVALVPRDETT